MDQEHKFYKSQQELVTKFPVAIKASGTSDAAPSWYSVMVEERQEPTLNIEDVKTLHEKRRIQWMNLLYQIVSITDTSFWKICMLLLIFVNYMYVSYAYFFLREKIPPSYPYITSVLDAVYMCDYFCALTVYFWKKLQLRLVTPPRNKYTLIFDAFLILPYNFLYLRFSKSYALLFLRTFPFLRLFHFPRFFKEKSNTAGENHWKYFVWAYFTYLVILIHTSAWILYLRARPIGSVHLRGWYTTMTAMSFTLPKHFEYYLRSVYFALINITNVGFGDVIPQSLFTVAITCTAMCLGFVLTTGYFTGTLTSLFVNDSQRKAYLRIQLNYIRRHLKKIEFDEKRTTEIMAYYEMLWIKKKGIREAKEFQLLPLPLQMEISFDVNISLLQCSLLFRNNPEPFLRTLSLAMKHEFYRSGDIICYQSVIKNKMVCVVSGVLEILSEEDNQSPIISFGAGSCLGEAALLLSLPAKASVRVPKYTELQVLYRKDFFRIIELYPEIFANVRAMILERIDNYKYEHRHTNAETDESINISLFTSQTYRQAAIKKLKDRMNPATAFKCDPNEHFFYGALPLYRYTETVKMKKGKFLCLTAKFPWILQPNTTLTWAWEVIVVLNTVMIGIIYPLYISYEKSFPLWVDELCILLELINFFDIYVILTTAVIEKDCVLTKVKDILFWHLNTVGFYLDVFSIFYLEIIAYIIGIADGHAFYIFKFNRLLKLYRICKFFDNLERSLSVNIMTVRLIKYPTYLIYTPFLFGSVLFLETCYNPTCLEDGWYHREVLKEVEDHLAFPLTKHIVYYSLYYALSCMAGEGFGDITIGNKIDLVTVSVGVVIGILVFGYCIAEFSAIFTHNLKTKIDFQEQFFNLKSFMADKKMDEVIKKRIENFFLLQWYYNKGINVVSNKSLFYNAPPKIQQDILIKERMETIMSVPLFSYTERDYIQQIAAGSRLLILPPNEVVSYRGGYSRELYVIQKGYCSQEIDVNTHKILGPGAHFGSASLLHGNPNMTTVVTITHVQIITVSSLVYQRAVSMFPNVKNEIRAVASLVSMNEKVEKLLDKIKAREDNKMPTKFDVKETKTESFINVWRYCKKTGEDYNRPFKRLGQMRWIKYLLVPVCIHPNGVFIKLWITLRLLAAVVICMTTIFNEIRAPYYDKHIYIELIIYLDMYVMLHVGYYGNENQLVFHPYKTAVHYLKGLFVIDFVLCFPWFTVLKLLTDSQSLWMVEFLKILQLYRLPLAFQYLESDITKQGEILEMLKFLPMSLIVISVWACIVIVSSCQYTHITEVDEILRLRKIGVHVKLNEYSLVCKDDSWLYRSNFFNYKTPLEVFVVSVYWCTSTLTGAGFGDITAEDTNHLIIIVFMIICGVLFFCYSFASISSHKAIIQTTLSHYQEMLNELKSFMIQENVSSNFQKSLINYVEYTWTRSAATESNKVLSNLHTALHEDAVLHMYEDTLRAVPVFENLEQSFFRIIGKEALERYYQKGDLLIPANHVVSFIYVIYRGKVDVMIRDEVKATMGKGGMCGNLTSQPKAKVSVTIVATTNVDVLLIKTETFNNILKMYPDTQRIIDQLVKQFTDFVVPNKLVFEGDHVEADINETSSQGLGKMKSGSTFASYGTQPSTNLKNWFRMSIPPDSKFLNVYDVVCMIAAYFNCLIVTYMFTFQHHTTPFLILAIIMDLLFIFKMLLDVQKAYINRYGDCITDRRKIRARYFRNWKARAIDFVANVPISYLAFLISLFCSVDSYFLFSILRLITLLRYYYVMEFYNLRSRKLQVKKLYLKLSSIFMWIILWVHSFACLFYLMACPVTYCRENSWVSSLSLVTGYEKERGKLSHYFLSVYFLCNILTTTGTGDILPCNITELVFVTALLLATKFCIGLFIGDVTSVLNACTSYMVNYECGIKELRDYLKNRGVRDHQMEKMWHYVQQLWTRSRGKQMPRLINMLPQVKTIELLYEIYGVHLRNSYFFSGTEEAFVRQLCMSFKHVIFFPGNYIVQHGDSDQSMYFIHRGEVDILTVHPNLTETVHDVLRKGEMFGIAQGLYLGVPHHFSFRAKTTVNIVSLKLSEWHHLLKFFPESRAYIYKRAEGVYFKM